MSARPFADLLRDQRAGGLHDELTQKLHELVSVVEGTGKAGKLVLTLEVKKHRNDLGGAMIVIDDVELKLPKSDRGGAIYFLTPEGNLSKSDPQQRTMNLQEVNRPLPTQEVG